MSLKNLKLNKTFQVIVDYFFGRPVLVLQDLDLVREIYVKHFDSFMDRKVIQEANDVSKTPVSSNFLVISYFCKAENNIISKENHRLFV